MVIEMFKPDRHKIVFNKVGDEHPDSDVDKYTLSAKVKLAKVLDELDIGQPPAECLLMVLSSRRKLVTSRDELRPVMCEGCEVTFVEEGHDVERVTVRSDVVKEKKSVGEAHPIGNGAHDANNSPNREQDQGLDRIRAVILNNLINEKLRAKERWSFNTDTGS